MPTTDMTFTGAGAQRRLGTLPWHTSGCSSVDTLLGGGYKAGRVYLLFGESSSGKSQLAMQAVLCAAHGGTKSLYVDSEGAFRPERVREIASARGWRTEGLLESISYLRVLSAARQADAVRGMSKSPTTSPCRVVVLDSLTRNFSLDLPGRSNMPDRQGALDVHLSEIARDAFLHGRAYILTNRVTFGERDRVVGVGGKTVTQLVHRSLHLKRSGESVQITDEAGRTCAVRLGAPGIEG